MIASRRPLGGIVVMACAKLAWGAHPFVTEDTNTQGTGRFELQLGAQFTRTQDQDTNLSRFQFAPQLTYGVLDNLDVLVRPSYSINFSTGSEAQRASGYGDAFAGIKWRFYEAGEWSGALTGGAGFPTGNGDRGLDAGRTTPYAYLVGQWTTEALQVSGSVGAIRNAALADGRGWLAHASATALWTPTSGWQAGIDLIADQNPLKWTGQWPAAALVGVIYSVTPYLDVDCGYQRGLNRSAPNNQYLLGATLRW